MAQFADEPLISIAPEEISTSVPPTLALTPYVPLVTPGFHPLVPGTPQHAVGLWQTYASPDPVTESILMTTTRTPEAPLTPLSNGYVTFDNPSTAVTFAVGSLSPRQSVSLPFGSNPLPTLHLSIPTDGSPDVQYQHLMETA